MSARIANVVCTGCYVAFYERYCINYYQKRRVENYFHKYSPSSNLLAIYKNSLRKKLLY